MNYAYSLSNDVVTRSEMTPVQLAVARADAAKHDAAMRSCWVCNPAHNHFLATTADNFLFWCIGCGHWYFNGMDITEDDSAQQPSSDDTPHQ